MPKSNTTIAAPPWEALFECFSATTRLVRPELRRQIILVGGAASIAHSSQLKTEDVDIAAPSTIIIQIRESVSVGALNFHLDPDGKISFDASLGFRVRLNLIEIGGGCIERMHACEPFFEGSSASTSDLLRLRAVTVVDRGSDGEVDDFRWLLSRLASAGQVLPELDDEELEYMAEAGESCLGTLDRLVYAAVLGGNNISIAFRLLGI